MTRIIRGERTHVHDHNTHMHKVPGELLKIASMIAVNCFAAVIKKMRVNSLKQCKSRVAGHGTDMAFSHCDAPTNITGEDVECAAFSNLSTNNIRAIPAE